MSDFAFRALRSKTHQKLQLSGIPAVVGDELGNVFDVTIPGNVLCRIQYANGYGAPISVRGPVNSPMTLVCGSPVELIYTPDKRLQIKGIDANAAAISGINPLAANLPQLNSGGFVGQQSLATALVTPQAVPDLTVAVKSWLVIASGTYYEFPGNGSFDLSSYVPSSGNNRYVVIFIQSDFATLVAHASTARSIADIPLNATDVQECITAAAATDMPLAAVRMYGGQTTIQNADITLDLRQMINLNSSAAGNVSGPGASTDRAIPTWNGTSGLALRNNANDTIDASGNLTANAWRLPAATTLTEASDAVTITQGYHLIEAETGTTDNLATINGGVAQQLLIIQADTDDTITVKHGTGNIFLNSGTDRAISGKKTLALFYHGSNWTDIDFGDTSGTVTAVTASSPLASSGGTTPDISLSGAVAIAHGGTGQTTQTAGFDALSPTTTKGDLIVDDGTDAVRVAVGADGTSLTAISGDTAGIGYLVNANQGFMRNGKIVTSVASNNLTVAIKTLAGTDPSATDPVYIRIGNTDRAITAALSVTKNAGTNWMNLGGAELATQDIDLFVYLGYNATDGVVVGFAQFPYASVYGDFSTTSTNEKYAAISTITNAAAGDEYENIGRFNATLSASAAFNWSIPATSIIVNHPTIETRGMAFVPQVTAISGTFTTVSATGRYLRIGRSIFLKVTITITTNGTANFGTIFTLPFSSQSVDSMGSGRENAVTGNMLEVFMPDVTHAYIQKYDGSYGMTNGYVPTVSLTYEAA